MKSLRDRSHMSTPIDHSKTIREIWDRAVLVADPESSILAECLRRYDELAPLLNEAEKIIVVGAGKAGGRMATGLEAVLQLEPNVIGHVNVPDGTQSVTRRVHLHPARPVGSNHPTAEGVDGTNTMLKLLESAGPKDLAFCLLSGGGSALMPAPVDGVSLSDKQAITRLLHASGATIEEMNAVRKHLSQVKGGRLAQAFRGRKLYSFIISDVVGDPLDVIASGPTAPDPTTYSDALAVIDRYQLKDMTPSSIIAYLESGVRGEQTETLKSPIDTIENVIIASNVRSLDAASVFAGSLGYSILNLGSFIEGETKDIAIMTAGIVRSIRQHGQPTQLPACILMGGETTVTLGANPGAGGRNQEFVLALIDKLGVNGMSGVTVLSAGTDGEDGPTDAAGAWADQNTLLTARLLNRSMANALSRHDAYHFFQSVGGLIQTGLTGTNVMDVRIVLIHSLE